MENIETLLAAVAQTQGFDDDEPVVSSARGAGLENSESTPANRGETGGLQPTGGVSGDARPPEVVDMPPPAAIPAFPAVGQVIGDGVRRKRGRPPKLQLGARPPPPKRKKQENEEEDVCFICFDGGSLVLCDRKYCPKAYHPACIKRDEAFFKSKAKWNCGWHLCSVCEKKASHYMCYTCTYSLCKGCTKDADYLCVRGNKGFCSTCMKTIMLIENKDQANNDSVQVDFDDKTSWEYLFKVYWVCLKEKLSLTLSELTQAKKPCKGVLNIARKPQLGGVLHAAVDGKVSNSYRRTEHLELNRPHVDTSLQKNEGSTTAVLSIDNHVERLNSDNMEGGPLHDKDTVKANMDKVTDEPSIDKANDEPGIKEATDKPSSEKDYDKPIIVKDTDKPCICKSTNNKVLAKSGIDSSTEWATQELLDFLAHVRNGDTSAISQFDAQELLLEYIKINNLRDPRQKSQIICDLRLRNLFGKPCVSHLEMLKLLDFHFLIKEDSQKSSFIPAGFVSSVVRGMEVDGNTNGSMQINSRKRKSRKKSEDRAVQNNLNEYAAIDVHNINLIYLRCNLMENLLKDQENFNSKVIGSIVRIRISSNDQKQDVYRLVQVVGTIKVAGPYKIGDRTADVMLVVFNFDKKELVSIDAISNQEFSEDECRRFRQSIRCGLVKPYTVGEVQDKAMALRPVKIDDWLEAEFLRLNHLRDRASENGRKKEHREYVDKLMLLKSPEEYRRRIAEVPEVHADPKMSPNYESEEDTRHGDSSSKADECVRPSYSGFPRNGRKLVSPNKKGKEERVIHAQNGRTEKTDASGSHRSKKNMDQVSNNSAIDRRSDQAVSRSWEASTATASVGNSPSTYHIETEKLWHYRDPNSKIQGPFSMMQLRKWRTTGLFPSDMRIWTNHEQYDSLLLIDALNGHFHGASELSNKPPTESRENGTSGSGDIGASEVTNGTNRDGEQTEPASRDNVSILSDINTGVVRDDESRSSWPRCWDLLKDNNSSVNDAQAHAAPPSSSSGQTDVAPPVRGRASCNNVSFLSDNNTGVVREDESGSSSWPQCWDLLKDNNSSANDVQAHEAPPSSSSGQTDVAPPGQGQDSTEFNCGSRTGEKNLSGLNQNWTTSGHEQHNHRNNEDQAGQSSGENLRSLNIDWRSNDKEPGPVAAPASKSPDSNKQGGNMDALDLLSPTPKTANQQSVSSDVPMQNFSCLELLSPTPRSNNEDQGAHATETKQSGLLNFPVPDSGISSSGASAGVIGGLQLSDVADEWCGYSPTPAKPSTQGWDSGLVSSSSLKPPEATSENVATLTLDAHHLTLASSSHPAPTVPNWLTILNDEPIELDALGEESVSDLLAEVDAMESQGALPSPTSAMRFAKELIEDCKDDCFSSIEDFSSAPDPPKSDALSSTGEVQLNSQSSAPYKPIETFDALDSFRRSSVHSSASSEGETNVPVYSGDAASEFHPSAPNNTSQAMVGGTVTTGSGSDTVDPGWGTVQGNINLVTVQGNVNLVLGGPGQGMANLGWGTNPGTAWVNPNINHSPINGSLPWDGQRKYGGERFASPRDRGYHGNDPGFMRSRPPWGRQPYGGGGGYSRPLPKGQRVCKFYGSGHCKKGAFCDYLHP